MKKQKIIQSNKIHQFLLPLLACLLFLGPALPVRAADSGSCGEDLTWAIEADVLTISGSGDMLEYSDGSFPGWYGMREKIRTIVLPSGLTSISDFAFYGCENVTSIQIPTAVTKIGDYAFAQCTSLLYAELGTGVETLGEGAFQECDSLTSISFPPSLTAIGNKAFYRCYGLTTVTVPVTVERMGTSIFAYCSGLIRATVNAPLAILPDWTFYGCEALKDVSLAATIRSLGNYSFQNCDNLGGIYTQEGNVDTAYDLSNSIPKQEGAPSQGSVGVYDIPDTSVSASDNGESYIEKEVTQIEDTVITIVRENDYTEDTIKKTTSILATANKAEDWTNVARVLEETQTLQTDEMVTIRIQLIDHIVKAEWLSIYAGKNVILELVTTDGVIWKLNMSRLTDKNFSGKYNLYVTFSEISPERTSIESEKVYAVGFSDHIDFNVDLGIRVGNADSYASFFQKSGGEYELLQTSVVDGDGNGWFSLASTDKGMEYFIGMNVTNVTVEEAQVPETMLEQYGLDGNDATLMDGEGVKYQITGRTSKWGISSARFMTYVFVAMAAVVLVVGAVMISWNIIKRSKERYADLAREEDSRIDEEKLRIEVLKELLQKKH